MLRIIEFIKTFLLQSPDTSLAALRHRLYSCFLFAIGMLFLTACGGKSDLASVAVNASYESRPLTCGASFSEQGKVWRIDKLAWFLTQFAVRENGVWRPLLLVENEQQVKDAVLIEFVCNKANQVLATVHFGQALDWQKVQAIRFKLGLPFELNHANPLTQPQPINRPDMFWSWQGGHKFMRIELSAEQQSWAFHLGSVGCVSDSAMRAPLRTCIQPNIFEYELQVDGKAGQIQLNIDKLFTAVELAGNNGCRFHGSQEAVCTRLLQNLQQQQLFVWQR